MYKNTWVPLYNLFHYSTVLAITWLKDGPQNCCIQTKIWVMFIIPCRKIVAEYYGFMLVICVSVPPSIVHLWYIHLFVFWFLDDNFSKCQWIFTKLGYMYVQCLGDLVCNGQTL